MFKLFAIGVGFGAGFQAWRNYPPDGPVDTDMLWVVLVVALGAAYLGGRFHGRTRGGATAVAVASAEATATAHNQVQVINVLPRHLEHEASPGIRVPSDSAPWMVAGPPELDLDQLDGMELSELVEERQLEL